MSLFIVLMSVLLGLSVGSFLNAAIYRLGRKESVLKGRSRCTKCGYQLAWHDLIPLLSYLWLKGRCRNCDVKIGGHYFVIELATGVLFASVMIFWMAAGRSFTDLYDVLYLVRDWIAVAVLVFLFVFDLKHFLLPDSVTLPSILFFGIINLILGYSFGNIALAVAAGAGFFLFQYVVSKGKWIGGGDIRFGALIGALLGWPHVLLSIIISYFAGAIIGSFLLLSGRKKIGAKLPFGTFLAFGALITLWWGDSILNWYLAFI